MLNKDAKGNTLALRNLVYDIFAIINDEIQTPTFIVTDAAWLGKYFCAN
jgi:hypothetical protein